jgi:hypothetical protein
LALADADSFFTLIVFLISRKTHKNSSGPARASLEIVTPQA